MSDMNFMERERNKDRLRRNIIEAGSSAGTEMGAEEEEIVRAAEQSSRKRRLMTILGAVVILAAIFIMYR